MEKKINFSDKLISLNFLKFDLKGFLFSRIKYSLILIFAFFPLIYLLKKKKPEFLIVNLFSDRSFKIIFVIKKPLITKKISTPKKPPSKKGILR